MNDKKLQINILVHNNRINFTSRSISEICKINKKEGILVNICFTNQSEEEIWEGERIKLINSGIDAVSNCVPQNTQTGTNYMDKIRSLINSDYKYSCSMDDDIILSFHLWDYMIENLKILEKENNLFLSPLISNGIPSVDIFIEDFCDSEQKKDLHSIFTKTKIDNMWGANYEHLNKERPEWDITYYDDVKKTNHYYKGIHPVRVSAEAHMKIAEIICRSPNKIMGPNKYKLEEFKFPYFCNSFYFIKTETWRNIINDQSLFRDEYDEVPLNLYMEKNNLNMVFVRNGFCVHMAYNTLNFKENGVQQRIEDYYINNFVNQN